MLINREGLEVDETGEDRWLGIARNSKHKNDKCEGGGD